MSILFLQKPVDFQGSMYVVSCLIEHKDHILLLKRSETCQAPLQWTTPGGKVEAEESIPRALERELCEELSISCIDWGNISYVTSLFIRHPRVDYQLYVFRWMVHEKFQVQVDPKEHVSYIWHPKNRLHEVDLIEGALDVYALSCEPTVESSMSPANDESCPSYADPYRREHYVRGDISRRKQSSKRTYL